MYEWEKAARGNTGFDYPWGDDTGNGANANFILSLHIWNQGTTPVGYYNGQEYDGFVTEDTPSPFGVYDMAGNVSEWTSNYFDGNGFSKGGNYFSIMLQLKSWDKINEPGGPTSTNQKTGFRLAIIPEY